jgi:hypothetical protein
MTPMPTQDAPTIPLIKMPKLTDRERKIVRGAVDYGLSDVGGDYYQLGGHGCVPVRYHPDTLRSLERRGLVVRRGYWAATDVGRAAVAVAP